MNPRRSALRSRRAYAARLLAVAFACAACSSTSEWTPVASGAPDEVAASYQWTETLTDSGPSSLAEAPTGTAPLLGWSWGEVFTRASPLSAWQLGLDGSSRPGFSVNVEGVALGANAVWVASGTVLYRGVSDLSALDHVNNDIHVLHAQGRSVWVATSAILDLGVDTIVGDARVLVSHDAGARWAEATLPDGAGSLADLAGGGDEMWAVGRGGDANDGSGVVLRSVDQGATWRVDHADAASDGFQAVEVNGREVWVGSSEGAVYRRDTTGVWAQKRPAESETSIRDLVVRGAQVWAVGGFSQDGGLVLYSPDRGEHWQRHTLERGLSSAYIAGDTVHVTGGGVTLVGAPGVRFPGIARARLVSKGTARVEVELSRPDAATLVLHAADELSARRSQFTRVGSCGVGKNPRVRICTFDPAAAGVRSGEPLHLRVELARGGTVRSVLLPTFTFDRWAFLRPYRAVLLVAGAALALAAAWGLLLLVRPLALLALWRSGALVWVDQLPAAVSAPLKAGLRLSMLPWFATRDRVLDAWVQRHAATVAKRFSALQTVQSRGEYVPLPLRVGEGAESYLLDQPSPAALRPLFQGARFAVEVVGTGGAGKTTLAVQMARWAMAPRPEDRLTPHRMLPVLVEQDTTDLRESVRGQLCAWLNVAVDPAFADLLMRRRRVLVIVDALSERALPTIGHVRGVHTQRVVNALLVTSRVATGFAAGTEVTLYPVGLSSDKLLYFITRLLVQHDSQAYGSIREQLELGRRLGELFAGADEDEVPITPVLVTLAVEKAILLAREGRPVDDLPDSVPEVYIDYLRRVNPQGGSVADPLPQQRMLDAAQQLGMVALRQRFVPTPFPRSAAWDRLTKAGFDPKEGPDPVDRLVRNGVLSQDTQGPEPILRFVLDPVAEYAAALGFARECGADLERWRTLYAQVKGMVPPPTGFATALRLVVKAYGKKLGWAGAISLAPTEPRVPAAAGAPGPAEGAAAAPAGTDALPSRTASPGEETKP